MVVPGFLYVLVNPSLGNMVKVGKTARDPQGRCDELSRATGVPTPFILVFEKPVSDMNAAEAFVHETLEQRGYRVAANREFFKAPVNEVIDSVMEAATRWSYDGSPICREQPPVCSNEMAVDMFDQGMKALRGQDDTLQDVAQALSLLKRAAKLGHVPALRQVGRILYAEEGIPTNPEEAKRYLVEGVKRGDDSCWEELAHLFFEAKHKENWNKSWGKYFASKYYELLTSDEKELDCNWYLFEAMAFNGHPIRVEDVQLDHIKHLRPFATRLVERLRPAPDAFDPGLHLAARKLLGC